MRRKNDIPAIYQPKPKTDPTARAVRYYDTNNKRRTKFLGHIGTEDFRRRYAEFMQFYNAMHEAGFDAESFKAKKEKLEVKSPTLGEVLIWAWDNVVPRLYVDEKGKKKREWSAAQMVVGDMTAPIHHKRMCDIEQKDLRDIWVRWAGSGSLQGSTVRVRIALLKRLLKETMFERKDMIDPGKMYEISEWNPPPAYSNSADNRGVREKKQVTVATDEEILKIIEELERVHRPGSAASLILKTIRTSSIRPHQIIQGGSGEFLPVEYVDVRSDCVVIYPDPKTQKREKSGPDIFISIDPDVIEGFACRTEGREPSEPVFKYLRKRRDGIVPYFKLRTFYSQIEKAREKIRAEDPDFGFFTAYSVRHRAKDVLAEDLDISEKIISAVMNHAERGTKAHYGTKRLEAPIRRGVEALAQTWNESVSSFSR